MKNKILSLLLVLVMAVAVFVSCAPSTPPDDDDPTPPSVCKEHVDENHDGKCDKCGKSMGGSGSGSEGSGGTTGDQDPAFTWDTTDLLYRMTNSSNNQELPSGCERYLAGEGTYDTRIDKLVRERNLAAQDYAKVKVEYLYYPDNQKEYNWSSVQEKIVTEINSGSSSTPDILRLLQRTFSYDGNPEVCLILHRPRR